MTACCRGSLQGRTGAVGLPDRSNGVKEFEVGKVVDVDIVADEDAYVVAAETYGEYVLVEVVVANGSAAVIILDDHFVGAVLGVGTSSNKGLEVAPEEYLDGPDAPAAYSSSLWR